MNFGINHKRCGTGVMASGMEEAQITEAAEDGMDVGRRVGAQHAAPPRGIERKRRIPRC